MHLSKYIVSTIREVRYIIRAFKKSYADHKNESIIKSVMEEHSVNCDFNHICKSKAKTFTKSIYGNTIHVAAVCDRHMSLIFVTNHGISIEEYMNLLNLR